MRPLVVIIAYGVGLAAIAAALPAAVPAVPSIVAAPPTIEAAFQRYWEARNPGDAWKAAQEIIRSGVSFEDAVARLKRGRSYKAQTRRGVVHLMRRAALGDFAYDVYVPEAYDPQRAYQLRFQLHGGVMMRDQGSLGSLGSRGSQGSSGSEGSPGSPGPLGSEGALRGRGGSTTPLFGAEQIYVMPSAWRDAPWWSGAQLENLAAILDTVKRTYNVDENRVVVSGVSDGATGAYYVAMREITPFAGFLPLNGSLMVLANDRLDVSGELFPTNLVNKPLFVVNGGKDPLYPSRAVEPYLEHLKRSGVTIDYHPQPDAGHNTTWWPQVEETFEAFVRTHPRDPLPSKITWEVSDRQTPGRAHWLIIDRVRPPEPGEPRLEPDLNVFSGDGINHGRELFGRRERSGRVDLDRAGNTVHVQARGVAGLTLLISPDAFDLSAPIVVMVNGRLAVESRVEPSVATLLKWSARDDDRTMLFGAELHVPLRP
jgi:hypothetical protein